MVCSELLLGFGDGNFPELLEILHEFEGSLTSAGTGGLVTFFYLSVGVHDKSLKFFLDLCYKLFHFL